ncbi:mannitol dehydrogenase C-terminal domain-containing protein [Sphaerosporella brunnea]|uniref:Mannitol-1-phosphate 5-dehydrogenase n=1 Tax=Sphaerosporella brunnea TaxID=1250544 RepID=A0A5J5ER32_9PEZI|nr:mannitol dehydrogenase C-terminal domain-containing protein [Sphaerosporella brunnea]KAA8901319.1 mannitol dehydrogenase C-terminal domain-containing protein [Sphaerosporella brunnea]
MSSSMNKEALHFGAGNIGRGFIGALLAESGYHVTFADVVEKLINALNEYHSYTITILDVDPEEPRKEIRNVSGVMSNDPVALNKAIVDADIITTAVGPNVLRIIARSLAAGITARRKAGKEYLNIIACENMTGASSHLQNEILKHITDEEDKAYMEEYIGFPNCAVDRIVPPVDQAALGGNILSVGVEAFFEWIVEEPAFKGPRPEIKGMKLTDNLVAYVQRKLFTLNCGHAITAYLGYLKGYQTVDQSLKDRQIEEVVHGAMLESGAALCKKHGFDFEEHKKYIEKIMKRFRNPYIKDDVARVGREPLRKLGPADRLVGPTKMCLEYKLPYRNLTKGIAAALHYDNPEDKQSVEVQNKIKEKGLESVCEEVLQFPRDSDVTKQVIESYNELKALKKQTV